MAMVTAAETPATEAPAAAAAAAAAAAESATPGEASVESMREFIENALALALKGNAASYNVLVRHLSSRGDGDALARRRILRALPRCVSSVAREPHAFRQLLDALFRFDFMGDDAAEAADYAQLVVHLVSSNSVFVVPALQTLVRALRRPPALPTQQPPADAEAAEARVRLRFERAHETLRRVLALAPTASNVLFPVLSEHAPHKRLDAAAHVAFLSNALTLSTYAPGLRERVLALVTDQLVAVDVEIKLDESEEDVFTMDDFLDDDLLPDSSAEMADEMADKLDQMMLVMFEHMEATAADARHAALLFQHLLKAFERSVLNTHRSKYPQFLLFVVCEKDPQLQDVFISQLLASSLDPQTPPVTRRSCGAYLASFLARAKFVSVAYLQKALYHLLKWLHGQMDVLDADDADTGDSDRFQESIYVSTLQTACYLLCFRGLEMAQTESGYDFLRSLGWERLLLAGDYCPLALCQPTVAAEFLNLVEALDLVSDACVDRVDRAMSAASVATAPRAGRGVSMERSATPARRSSSSSAATSLGLRQPLETFFPFDPYLLRRSFRFVGPLYLYWKHADPSAAENAEALATVKTIIQSLNDNDDNDESGNDGDDESGIGDEESDMDHDEDASMVGSVPAAALKELPSSFMSVSSSVDYNDDDDDDNDNDDGEELLGRPTTRRKPKRAVPPRDMFAPSPALSASSPPSRLPPMSVTAAFTLGGFDDDDPDASGF